MPLTDRAQARAAALHAAAVLHGPLTLLPGVDRQVAERAAQESIRRLADGLAAYVLGTTRIHLIPGPVVDEAADVPPGTPQREGEVMTQMNTGHKFELSIDARDAAGFPTRPNVTWSIDDPSVAELQVAEDEQTCVVVSGAPGSAVLTVTIEDETAEGQEPLSVTHAVDVVPAGTATIELVAGEVVDE
ncbi:hypothetical protein OG884_18910 [Streptosporangium sp. NBC_01755]|uniref:hypothetical protein n=1 Tax=Streptosporangium sp. NBC_01755 TaxID=2975949 RepID=UPI002DD9F358|nr:hypothetical protein [Streptosporangium sp. NBC_01755]WSD03880.1 hypothetical protein OG884_18910 [Streptosporangium sp. NBC_01755]